MHTVISILLLLLCYCTPSITYTNSRRAFSSSEEANLNDVDPILIDVSWSEMEYKLHTVPSIQVITNPMLTREYSPIHKEVFSNLAQLKVSYARYAAWFAYPRIVVAELDPPSGIYQCGNVEQNCSITLSCRRGGGIISKVDFASYGTGSGACGQMEQGACHASASLDIVQQVCIGQQECIVPATNDLFGDPCKCTMKHSISSNKWLFSHQVLGLQSDY